MIHSSPFSVEIETFLETVSKKKFFFQYTVCTYTIIRCNMNRPNWVRTLNPEHRVTTHQIIKTLGSKKSQL